MKNKKKQANGKNEDAAKLDLREFLFAKEKNPFGTLDPEQFSTFLGEAGIVNLQEMAVKAGISASGGIPTLRNNLKLAFEKYTAPSSPIYASALKGVGLAERNKKIQDILDGKA